MTGNGRDFVSLYFPVAEGLDSLKGRLRNVRNLLDDNPDEAQHFDLTLERMRRLVEENPTDAESLCVFGCDLLEFASGYPISMPLAAEVYVGPSPYIRPLAELQDEYQTFAVVACDNKSTQIYLVTNETAELEERVKGNVKNRVRKGGWSQKRYARRREQQLHHYSDEVAQLLTEFVQMRSIKRVVLTGSVETMNEIEAHLKPDIAERIVAKRRFDLHRSEDELIEDVYEAYFEQERAEERHLWDQIKNEYMKHGLAAVGPTDVLAALGQGRVEELIITRNAQINGTQCRDCESLVHGTPQTCQSCGSRSVFQLDLIDELTKRAELTSARAEYSDEIPGLTQAGHVAALLRW
jgi:peptide subunit release factor 1 (eRF1)